MSFENDLDTILQYAHYWNWAPDWLVLKKVYMEHPETYSILTPFAYSYLEEMIRSTTSEYGIEILDINENGKKRKVGKSLLKLAKKENFENKSYIDELNKIERYFENSSIFDQGDNRNSVDHGYMHSRFWTQESFEKLIHDIAILSQYSRF